MKRVGNIWQDVIEIENGITAVVNGSDISGAIRKSSVCSLMTAERVAVRLTPQKQKHIFVRFVKNLILDYGNMNRQGTDGNFAATGQAVKANGVISIFRI